MKKIIIAPLKMNTIVPVVYKVAENCIPEREEPIYFPVNSAVSYNLNKNDDVKIILIETKGGEIKGSENASIFFDEFERMSKEKVNITKTILDITFDAKIRDFKNLFLRLAKEIENDAEIYFDMTFGPKPLSILLFSFLRFAEKNFNCTIKNIVYGKVEFKEENEIKKNKSKIYDYSQLFMLNSFVNIVDSDSSDEAIKTCETFITGFEDGNE